MILKSCHSDPTSGHFGVTKSPRCGQYLSVGKEWWQALSTSKVFSEKNSETDFTLQWGSIFVII